MKKQYFFLILLMLISFTLHAQGWNHNSGWGPNPGYTQSPQPAFLPVQRFQHLKHNMLQEPFDRNRLMMAQQAADQFLLTSIQVRDLMHTFHHESFRLSFAKYAYTGVYDPQNYQLTYAAFRFQQSIAELDAFVAAQQPQIDCHGHGQPYSDPYGYGSPPPPPQPVCMNPQDFSYAMQSIRNQSFESSRMQVAKQITRDNYLSTEQVRQIIREFSFESSRLEYAKFAYDHVIDPERYYRVTDEFHFSSSVDDLMDWISQGRS